MCTHDVGFIVRVNILGNDAKSPDGRYSHLGALRVVEQTLEELEEILKLRLETLDDVFKNGEKNVDSDFTVDGLRGYASLLKEGKKGWPVVEGHFDTSNSSHNTSSGMADKVATRDLNV